MKICPMGDRLIHVDRHDEAMRCFSRVREDPRSEVYKEISFLVCRKYTDTTHSVVMYWHICVIHLCC